MHAARQGAEEEEGEEESHQVVWHTAAAVPVRSVDMPRTPTVSTPEEMNGRIDFFQFSMALRDRGKRWMKYATL